MMIEHWMHRRDFLERNQLTPLKIVARRNKLPVRCCKRIVENQQQLTDVNDDVRYSELTTTTTTTARRTNTQLGYNNQRQQDLSIGSYCHSTSSDEDEEEDDNYEMMNLNHPSRYVSDYSVLQYFESLKRRNRQLSFDDDDDNDDNDEDRQLRDNDHSSSEDSPHVTITPIPEKRIRAHLVHLRLSTSKIRHPSITSPSSSSSSSNLVSSLNNGSMVRCPDMSSPSVTQPTYSFAYCGQQVKKEEEHEPKEEPTADTTTTTTTTTVVSPSSMCTATCTNTSTSASSSTTTSTTTSPLTSSCTMNTTTLMHLKFELQQQTNIEANIEQEKIQNSTTTTTDEQTTTDNWWEIESDISQIEPNIYLGTYKGSLDKKLLQSYGITHIIQVVEVDQNPHRDEFQYFNVCVSDRVEEDLSTHFETCSDYIHSVLSTTTTTMTTTTTTTSNNNTNLKSNKVFVHCGAGISRSAALVIAYLMKYDVRFEGQFRAAYEYLKLRRMQVKPNRGFKKQLELYQQMLLLRTSVTVVTSGEVSSSNVQLEVGCSN